MKPKHSSWNSVTNDNAAIHNIQQRNERKKKLNSTILNMIGMGEFRAQYQYKLFYSCAWVERANERQVPHLRYSYTIIYLYFDIFCIISKWFRFQMNETRKCFNSLVSPFDLVSVCLYLILWLSMRTFFFKQRWSFNVDGGVSIGVSLPYCPSTDATSNEWHVLKIFVLLSKKWRCLHCFTFKAFKIKVLLVLNGRHKKENKIKKGSAVCLGAISNVSFCWQFN